MEKNLNSLNNSRNHNHSHQQSNNKGVLFFAFILTAAFATLEIIYAIISHSLVLLNEGVHLASDGVSLLVGAIAIWLAKKYKEKFKKAEPVAALLNGIGLMAIPVVVIFEAIKRLFYGEQDILSKEMFIIAVIGLIVNIIVAFALSRGEKENINVRAAMLHIIADLLSSITGIVVSLIIMFYGLNWIDAVASIIVSAYIFWGGLKISKESIVMLKE